MNKLIPLCGAMALVMAGTAVGEDFPLTLRTIPAKDVVSFPGNTGTYGLLKQSKPARLKKEPKAMSSKAFYAEGGDARTGLSFLARLDESKGDGKGYDRLILDLNQNNDLTDDPVVERVVLPTTGQSEAVRQMLFGPIQAPADKAVAGGRPVYYGQVYLFQSLLRSTLLNLPATSSRTNQGVSSGQLMLRAGWYLDATVELDGVKRKVGVLDGDSNLKLGDVPQPSIVTSGGNRSWSFRRGDSLLVDDDGSGSFENNAIQSEAVAFGPIFYLGAKAYKLSLVSDCKSLRLEPWTETLAEVTVRPRGDQVQSLTLAWGLPDDQWQLIRPGVANGKVLVPPGDYRLYACSLVGKSGARDQVMVSGMQRIMQTPWTFSAGKANSLDCGAPLEIKVTATKTRTTSRVTLADNPGKQKAEPQPTVRISARVAGAGGETYSSYFKGEGFKSRPPKPTFTVADAKGKTLANGNLEYG